MNHRTAKIPPVEEWGHREMLKPIRIWGDLAHFGIPSMKRSKVSYTIPTLTALRAIPSVVDHSRLGLFFRPVKLEYLNPVDTLCIAQTMHTDTVYTNRMDTAISGRAGKGKIAPVDKNQGKLQSPMGVHYLLNPDYRVTFELIALDAKKGNRFKKKLDLGADGAGTYDGNVYLGTSECMAFMEWDDGTREVCSDVNLLEPNWLIGDRSFRIEAKNGVVDYNRPEFVRALFDAYYLRGKVKANERRFVGGFAPSLEECA